MITVLGSFVAQVLKGDRGGKARVAGCRPIDPMFVEYSRVSAEPRVLFVDNSPHCQRS